MDGNIIKEVCLSCLYRKENYVHKSCELPKSVSVELALQSTLPSFKYSYVSC